MKKVTIIAAGMLMFFIFVSGCYPVIRENEALDETQRALEELGSYVPSQLPEHFQLKLSDEMMIDADIDVSHELSTYCVNDLVLTRHLFDQTECVNHILELLGNPEVINREVYEEEEYLENGKVIIVDNADLQDEAWVQGRDLYFITSIPKWKLPYEEPIVDESNLGSILEKVPTNTNLSFEDADVICGKLDELFEELNFENLLEPEVFSFTKEALQQWAIDWYGEEEVESTDYLDMTEQDEFYHIRYRQGYNGIPYYYYSNIADTISGSYNCQGTVLNATYGTQGYLSIQGDGLFDVKTIGEPMEIKPLQEMLEKFIASHSMAAGNQLTITKIGLAYLPILEDADTLTFRAVPVWYFIYDVPLFSGEGVERKMNVYNAVTGELYQ